MGEGGVCGECGVFLTPLPFPHPPTLPLLPTLPPSPNPVPDRLTQVKIELLDPAFLSPSHCEKTGYSYLPQTGDSDASGLSAGEGF